MNDQNSENRYLNRLSILLATLATFFITLYLMPDETVKPGSSILGFTLRISPLSLVPLMLMLLCAGGSFWLFATHPDRDKFKSTPWSLTPHVVLPSLATMITSTMLTQLGKNLAWWAALSFGLIIIGIILIAEYHVLTPGDESYRVVAPVLISLAFGLFLAFTISLATSQLRLYTLIALILIAAGFVSFRTVHLRTMGTGGIAKVFFCGLLCTEMAASFHYLFLKPVQYGLLISGGLYVLTSLVVIEGPMTFRKWIEPIVMTALLAILLVAVSLS